MHRPSSNASLLLINQVAIVLCQAYQLARARLSSAAAPLLRLTIERDHLSTDVELLRREVAVLRDHRGSFPAHKRPNYAFVQRLAILQIMRLRGWNPTRTAERIVVHVKTIRVCVQISRTTVQRVLREDIPSRSRRPSPPLSPAMGVEQYHRLAHQNPNRAWQLDLMCLQFLWLRFTVAALLDGCTRKILQLKAYRGAANSSHIVNLVRHAVRQFGVPRFLITDHGPHFRRRFRCAIEGIGIIQIKGRVRSPMFNGMVERLFKTIRIWQRFSVLPLSISEIRRRLARFQAWHNMLRPHQALGALTPSEAWSELALPDPIPIRTVDAPTVPVDVRRIDYHNDRRLLDPLVNVELLKTA